MPHVEQSFENYRVLSIADEIIFYYGWNNPNDGNGTPASRGTIFIEKTCDSNNATLWIKKEDNDPKSWDTWGVGDSTGSVVITPMATQTIDTFALADFTTAKWLINMVDGVSKSQSYTMEARAYGTDTDYTRYGIIGTRNMLFHTGLTSDGTTFTFNITNYESNSITVKYRRMAI